MRLLSVDWDYFFPVAGPRSPDYLLYDWGHSESRPAFLEHLLWSQRVIGILGHNRELPDTSGEEENFWDRFDFSPKCKLYISNSHLDIYTKKIQSRVDEIFNYDAHHDLGYNIESISEWIDKNRVTCEDWALACLLANKEVHTIYPNWKDWVMESEPVDHLHDFLPMTREFDSGNAIGKIHRIFLCRSSAWTPPWLDEKFNQFVEKCPVETKVVLDLPDRQWSWDYAFQTTEAMVAALSKDSSNGILLKNNQIALEKINKILNK